MTPQLREIVRTELLRSIVWFGAGLVGWPLVTMEVSWLNPTPLTVFGLPVITWAVLTASAIGVRSVTESDLCVQTTGGISVSLALGIMLGGVAAVYLVTRGGYGKFEAKASPFRAGMKPTNSIQPPSMV